MRTKLFGMIAIVAALSGVVVGSLVYSHAIPGVSIGTSGHKVWSGRFVDVSAWQSGTTEPTVQIVLKVSNATDIPM